MNFCVYLTIYKGNKLPPFYIGSTSINRIKDGYNGSPSSKKYKDLWRIEKRNNPELFITKILKTFETRSEAASYEVYIQQILKVHKNPLYINMGYFHGGHIVYDMALENCKKMATINKGKKRAEETKRKISASSRGKKLSQETKRKIGESSKSRIHRKLTIEERKKISERQTGEKHFGFGKPLSDEHKKKISCATKGKPKSKETISKMTKQTWKIRHKNDSSFQVVYSITEWAEYKGFPVRNVRRSFNRSGKYRDYIGELL